MKRLLSVLLLGLLFLPALALSQVSPGDRVSLGTWNGEALSFTVLSLEGDRALLLCDTGIVLAPYHGETRDITWEKSQLRAFLNGEFFETAFTEAEKARIPETFVSTPDTYGTSGGNDTSDRVFLLSLQEAESLLPTRPMRSCRPGIGVYSQTEYVSNAEGTLTWWLRSPGTDAKHAAAVDYTGRMQSHGIKAMLAVRPALYLENP